MNREGCPSSAHERLVEYYRTTEGIHDMLQWMSQEDEECDERKGGSDNDIHFNSNPISKLTSFSHEENRVHGRPRSTKEKFHTDEVRCSPPCLTAVKRPSRGKNCLLPGVTAPHPMLWTDQSSDDLAEELNISIERTRAIYDIDENMMKALHSPSIYNGRSSCASSQSIATTVEVSSPDHALSPLGKRESVSTAEPENENEIFAETVYLTHDEKEKDINSKLAYFSKGKKRNPVPNRFSRRDGSTRCGNNSSKTKQRSNGRNGVLNNDKNKDNEVSLNLERRFKSLLRQVNRQIEEEFGERGASCSRSSNE